MRTYYLALVDKTDTTFLSAYARHDEVVFSFEVSQDEGDFCGLTIDIEKPSEALLDVSRPQWVWLSMEEGSTLTPLFFGRVVGVPEDIQNDVVTVDFLAKPADFEDRKNTVAATLRVAPYWDYAFIDPQMWNDADAVLDSRTDVWHVDRLTGTVTVSSLISGEDGTLSITSDLIVDDSFALSYTDAPLRKVNLELRAMWNQQIGGSIDISQALRDAFQAVGSPGGYLTSYTGQGLYDTWPMEDDSLGNVYSFGPQTIKVADGKALDRQYATISVKYDAAPTAGDTTSTAIRKMTVKFRRWAFTISSLINYQAEIERTEDIRFTVYADVQNMVNDPEDEQAETITISSGAVGSLVGPEGLQEVPIGNTSRDQFWPIARGLDAIEFGLTHARSLLMRRARAAEVTVNVPIATAIAATCRKSATIYHPQLPGGAAVGKIVRYSFGVDGNSGEEIGQITIACMVGKNTTLTSAGGSPEYADANYVGPDYQQFSGAIAYDAGITMNYALPSWTGLAPASVGLVSVVVTGGESEQYGVLSSGHVDIDAACDALNEHYTKVDLHMLPLDTSPRELRYADSVVNLSIPSGIDLGAA